MPFFFRKPNIPKLAAEKDEKGLITAIGYHEDPAIQVAAIKALGDLASLNATTAITNLMLKTKDKNTLVNCLKALSKIKDTQSIEPLISLLGTNLDDLEKAIDMWDEKSSVLYWILETLGELADRKSVEPLIEIYQKIKRTSYKVKTIQVLGKINSSEAVDFLVSILNNRITADGINNPESLQIIKSLRLNGGEKAIVTIVRGLKNTKWERIECAPWDRKPSQTKQVFRVLEGLLDNNWSTLSENVLKEIETMPDVNNRYTYPETKVPGDDGWGHRDDETVDREDHDEKIDCTIMRERAKLELSKRQRGFES